MIKKIIWLMVLIFSVVMAVIFIVGFSRVASITRNNVDDTMENNSVESETTKEDTPRDEILGDNVSGDNATEDNASGDNTSGDGTGKNSRVILIVGDSIGAGVGDERNLGLGERFASIQDYEVGDLYDIVNLAVPGSETNNLAQKVLTGEMDEAIKVAELIFISIGGNNLNRIRSAESTMQIIEFEEKLNDHLNDLKKVLNYMRELNSDGEIVVLELYNPYGESVKPEDLRLLQEWNYQTRLDVLEVNNTSLVPLYDLFENNLDTLLSIDNFHPSGDGYELIARMINDVLGNK